MSLAWLNDDLTRATGAFEKMLGLQPRARERTSAGDAPSFVNLMLSLVVNATPFS